MSNNLSFEESIEKLEDIANKLESGELDLDSSLKIFEEGIKISNNCSKMLEKAEKKITILLEDGKKITEENFEE